MADRDTREASVDSTLQRKHVIEEDSLSKLARKRYGEKDQDLESPEKIWKCEFEEIANSVFLFPERKMSTHGNVFEGEMRSAAYGSLDCAIKLIRKSEENCKEPQILSKLGSHTHVVSMIESGIYEGGFEERIFIVLDKCHLQNMHQHVMLIREGRDNDIRQKLDHCKQLILGMKYIHENLIIHKDLKPSNILLSLDKRTVKVADFGLSQEIKSISSKVFCNHQFGTNGFRPPESFGDSWISLKSDNFSLGAALYFILSDGKSPFGESELLWNYNTEKGSIDISHLTIPESKPMERLIKLLLNRDRCCRPSIWQAADHPCWNGDDVEACFDYVCEDEVADCSINVNEHEAQDKEKSRFEVDNSLEFLRAMKEKGIDYSSNLKKSIVVFDWNTKHLQRFDPNNRTVTQMHAYNNEMHSNYFSAVSLKDSIYVFMKRSLYRLKYRDAAAAWEKMADLSTHHGDWLPAVAASGAIYVVGASGPAGPANAVSKYSPSLNQWETVKNKQFSTDSSATTSYDEYIYSIGGIIPDIGATNKAESFNVASQTWQEISSMQQERYATTAAVSSGEIFVAGGCDRDHNALSSVEKYIIKLNQWTVIKPMCVARYEFRCHSVNGRIYAFSGDPKYKTIEKYDIENDEWTPVEIQEELFMYESLVVEMKS